MTKRAGTRVTEPTCITGRGKLKDGPKKKNVRLGNLALVKVMVCGLAVFLGSFGIDLDGGTPGLRETNDPRMNSSEFFMYLFSLFHFPFSNRFIVLLTLEKESEFISSE